MVVVPLVLCGWSESGRAPPTPRRDVSMGGGLVGGASCGLCGIACTEGFAPRRRMGFAVHAPGIVASRGAARGVSAAGADEIGHWSGFPLGLVGDGLRRGGQRAAGHRCAGVRRQPLPYARDRRGRRAVHAAGEELRPPAAAHKHAGGEHHRPGLAGLSGAHRDDLAADWERAEREEPLVSIEPLP